MDKDSLIKIGFEKSTHMKSLTPGWAYAEGYAEGYMDKMEKVYKTYCTMCPCYMDGCPGECDKITYFKDAMMH